MPTDDCIRLDDRQRIANFRKQPIEANEYHSVDGAEGEFLWSSSPKNVDLLPQRPNLCLKHYPRPDQIDNHPTNEPAKIPHRARSSSDSRSTAKQDKVCDRDRIGQIADRPNVVAPIVSLAGHCKSTIFKKRSPTNGVSAFTAIYARSRSAANFHVNADLFKIFPAALLFHSAGLSLGFLGSRQSRRQTQTHAEDISE
jgi:hypothetical protein